MADDFGRSPTANLALEMGAAPTLPAGKAGALALKHRYERRHRVRERRDRSCRIANFAFFLFPDHAKVPAPGWVREMPINRLLKEGKFKPEDIDRLNRAFALALNLLGLIDRNDPICEMVARKIISINAAGTRDPNEIAKLAVKQLGP